MVADDQWGCPKQILRTDKIRMWIEEMFGDFKGHGFDLEATRLRHFTFIERLWRSVKYEDVYIKEYATVPALEIGLTHYFDL